MKVFFENLKTRMNPYNGKGKFVGRLAESFKKKGIDVVSAVNQCDINFCMNKLPSSKHGKQVVRLDNVTYCQEAMQVKTNANDRIVHAIKNADGIVYQSKIAKRVCETILNVSNVHNLVCGNGVCPESFTPSRIKLDGRVNFLIACQFLHPLRRVDKIIECWTEFVEDKDDAFLYLFYDTNMTNIDFSRIKNLKVGKVLLQDKLNNYVHSCNSVIMTTYRDSCPNFGAEILACGTPLIINKNNGLCDYINNTCGIVVDIDGSEEVKKENWQVPPFQNKDEIINALNFYYNHDAPSVEFPKELTIDYVADLYISFFKKLL